jgi:hypothetical protein
MFVSAALALLLQATGPGTPQKAWILTCDLMDFAGGADARPRVFRLAPRLLQEWKPLERQFGPNLCDSFICTVSPGGLQGSVTSASLIVTVGLDRQTGTGWWRTTGASNSPRTSGRCAARPETGGAPGWNR